MIREGDIGDFFKVIGKALFVIGISLGAGMFIALVTAALLKK